MRSKILLFLVCAVATSSIGLSQTPSRTDEPTSVLIRCDDLGMCHTVNVAAESVLATRLPISFSLMVACPWYQEAVEILKRYPHASVGVHLTLNAEWKNYRWGPVTGRTAVPSLVDSLGFFFPSRAALFGNKPSLREVELELRAQIERALETGLRIDYIDYHMGAAVNTLDTREIVESLAAEYGLAISRYFGEIDARGIYAVSPDSKRDTLVAQMKNLQPGKINLFVFHIGMQTPEMNALTDLNTIGLPQMSKHRESELNALLSPSVRRLFLDPAVKAVTYRDLVQALTLKGMKRPILKD